MRVPSPVSPRFNPLVCLNAAAAATVRAIQQHARAPRTRAPVGGPPPLAERLRIHNRMRGTRAAPGSPRRVEPGDLVLVRMLPAFPGVVPKALFYTAIQ